MNKFRTPPPLIALAVYTWTRTPPSRPGWDDATSRHRELAADLAAVRLVGHGPVVAATTARLARTRPGRAAERLADGPFARIATHPSTERRLATVTAYRGEDPKAFASLTLDKA